MEPGVESQMETGLEASRVERSTGFAAGAAALEAEAQVPRGCVSMEPRY